MWRTVFVAVLGTFYAGAACGQEPQPPSRVLIQSLEQLQVVSPDCRLDADRACESRLTKPAPWTLQSDTVWGPRASGDLAGSAMWQPQINVRGSYAAPGGVNVSFGVIGRRHYSLPLAVARPIGSDASAFDMATSLFEPAERQMLWDSTIRVEKVLKSRGAVHVKVVGEFFNLLDADTLLGGGRRALDPHDLSPAILKSRSMRFGLVLGF